MNRALVYNTFFSFLEDIDIDEFNIFWDIVHMGMINVFSFSQHSFHRNEKIASSYLCIIFESVKTPYCPRHLPFE